MQFAPSTYDDRRAVARDPDRASARARSDAALSIKIDAAWDANRKLYGARKIWHVLRRQGEDAARCTVERLMRRLGIRGVVRGKKVITTQPDTSQPCPPSRQICFANRLPGNGRGNCWDNAVAESFFNLLKRERIRRRKYKTREEARQDVFPSRACYAYPAGQRTTSSSSTTRSANTLGMACCHRLTSNSSKN